MIVFLKRIQCLSLGRFRFFKVEARTKRCRSMTSEAIRQCLGPKYWFGPSLDLSSAQRPWLGVTGGHPAHGPHSQGWPCPIGNPWDMVESCYEKKFRQDKDVKVWD
ncbi:hypothetical protein ACFX1R_029648 [Malus domestica]